LGRSIAQDEPGELRGVERLPFATEPKFLTELAEHQPNQGWLALFACMRCWLPWFEHSVDNASLVSPQWARKNEKRAIISGFLRFGEAEPVHRASGNA
jgi:hypothetical protein